MTLFEKIIAGEIPADIVHRCESVVAFRDISPQAPTHILVVPVKAIARIGQAEVADAALLGKLLLTAKNIAAKEGLGAEGEGYRLVINNGPNGGESVPHLHVHLLGGRQMQWPPG